MSEQECTITGPTSELLPGKGKQKTRVTYTHTCPIPECAVRGTSKCSGVDFDPKNAGRKAFQSLKQVRRLCRQSPTW
jgi:hypothetical protein